MYANEGIIESDSVFLFNGQLKLKRGRLIGLSKFGH